MLQKNHMIPVLTVIIIITISVLVNKIATIALMHTGLSKQTAQFQARSAFTGVGYATKESESFVNHPVRRRIIMLLMLMGNAGIVSVIATLLLTVLYTNDTPLGLSITARIGLLFLGILFLIVFFSSKIVDRWLSKIINYALKKYTRLNIKDYSGLLHLSGEFEISEIYIEENDWLAEKRLSELRLPKEGITVLGIERKNGTYLGIPGKDSTICPGDTLIVYGRAPSIIRLSERKKGTLGDLEREISIKETIKVKLKETVQDSTNKNTYNS
jgi:hypothetical protein